MCIHLFNPPAPNCAPTTGYVDQRSGQQCGRCLCVPPLWEVIASSPAAPAYTQLFMGRHVLTRDEAQFQRDLFEPCQWTTSIDLSAVGAPFFPGKMTLIYTSVGDLGGGGETGWFVIFDGLPAIGAVPADVEFYGLRMFGFPDSRPFRCLSQNTFYNGTAGGFGSGNFEQLPDSIIVQPFWP